MDRQTTLSSNGPGIQIVHLRGPRQGEIQHFSSNHIALGRSPDADVLFPPELRIVSRNHAEIFFQQGRYLLVNQSRNGSFVNNEEVEQAWLYPGDVITLAPGGPQLSFIPEQETQADQATQAIAIPDNGTFTVQVGGRIRSFQKTEIVVGSAGDCDLVLQHPLVQAHHLQLFFVQQSCRVRSLGDITSIHINGIPIRKEMILSPKDEVWLHPRGPGFRYCGEGKLIELNTDPVQQSEPSLPTMEAPISAPPATAGPLQRLFNFLRRR